MKKILTATALALLPFGASAADLPARTKAPAPEAAAAPGVSGYLGMYLGGTGLSWSDPNFLTNGWEEYPKGNALAFGGLAAANAWLSSNLSLQFSSEGEATSGYNTNDGIKETRSSGVLGAHLALRDPSSHAFGVFAGFSSLNNMGENGNNTGGFLGLEAQKYFGALTLYAQAGYGDQFNDTSHAMLERYWFVRGVARYFVNPNLRLSAELGYADGVSFEDGKWPANVVSWGMGIEHRFDRTPWSVFAGYTGDRMSMRDATGGGCGRQNVVQHTFMVGVKLNFGGGTLLANDRSGATFDLPKFHRAMPLTDGLEDSIQGSVACSVVP